MMSSVPLPWCTSKSTIATRLQAVHVERVARRHRHVVEEAEAHRLVARGMVAGRAHGAEGVVAARRPSPRRWPPPRRRRRAARRPRCAGAGAVSGSSARVLRRRPRIWSISSALRPRSAAMCMRACASSRSYSEASGRLALLERDRPGRWPAGGRRSRPAAAGTRGGPRPISCKRHVADGVKYAVLFAVMAGGTEFRVTSCR